VNPFCRVVLSVKAPGVDTGLARVRMRPGWRAAWDLTALMACLLRETW